MMFDSKIQEAYRKIKPSDSLRERVLAVDTTPVRAKVLPLRRLTNLAAAFVLFVALVILVRQTVSLDPNYVALSDGTVLSAEAVEVAPVTASYTGAAHISFAREGGDEETTYPEPVQVDGCFCLTLHARGLAYLEAAHGSLFLYDEEPEAYVDFGAESCVPMIYRYDNLLVVQTMSKSRQLAGGRVGYALGSPELIAALNRVKYSFNPYNVNRLSIIAGAAAVEDEAYFRQCCGAIQGNREWLVGELENLGFTVLPSQANFVFAKSDKIDGGELYRLLKENGILVRWFDADRIRDYVRITVGSMEQLVTLVDEVARLLDEI